MNAVAAALAIAVVRPMRLGLRAKAASRSDRKRTA